MNPFHVSMRSYGSICCIRVDGTGNADWLLRRLGEAFVFKNCEPLRQELDTSYCTFRIACGPQVTDASLARLLKSFSEVRLTIETD